MSDKELIKQEIKRIKEHTAKCGYPVLGDFEYGNREGRNFVCDKLLSFIDSLPEESASEDLEEAAYKYCEKVNHRQTDIITDSFKAGAEWQREKDKQLVGATQKISHQHGYDEGRLDMKEEILSKAVSENTLIDWYISSIDETIPPIWTEAHINELYKDFYLIPKEALQ
jgi:uncharacterized protein YihD (DUF1040 family)